MTVHLYGNAAVVTGAYRDKGTEKGKPFLRRGRFTDTWIYDKGAPGNAWPVSPRSSTIETFQRPRKSGDKPPKGMPSKPGCVYRASRVPHQVSEFWASQYLL